MKKFKFNQLKISTQLILVITLMVSIIIIGLAIVIGYRVDLIANKNANVIAIETANRYASIIQSELAIPLDEARALAHFFEAIVNTPEINITREATNLILKQFIEKNPNFLGVWSIFEPHVYDEHDDETVTETGHHDHSERFLPYWTRDSEGQGIATTLPDYDTPGVGDFYLIPKQRQQESVIEPYFRSINGISTFMTSLAVPIFSVDHHFIGVVGIDLDLLHLQKIIEQKQVGDFAGSYLTAFSTQGTTIASSYEQYFSKPVKDITDSSLLVENVIKNKSFLIERESKSLEQLVVTYGVLIHIGLTDMHWLVTANIPINELTIESQKLLYSIGFISLIAIAMVTLFLYLLSHTWSKPLAKLITVANTIAGGHLQTKINVVGSQEVSQLSQALTTMQTQLNQNITEQQRIMNEALRINQALDNVPTHVLISDRKHKIIYANQSIIRLLKTMEAAIQTKFTDFKVKDLIGMPINFLHQNEDEMRQQLKNVRTTYRTALRIEAFTLEVITTPIIDYAGNQLGWVTELSNRTTEIAIEQEVNAVMYAASQGDFEQRIDIRSKNGFFKNLSEVINSTLDYNKQLIDELIIVFAALAQGNLTSTITKKYAGSLEYLKNDVNTTIEKLTEVIQSIQETAGSVNNAAREISQGNMSLSQRIEEQAASLEQTAASMEEMTNTVEKNTDSANHAMKLVSKAREQAQLGSEVIQAMVQAISAISESSKQVTAIVGVIDSIAFQTNLLSLNAAIEAARAGEQGRGFAVVATEVRNLAQRTAEYAKQIRLLTEENVHKITEGTRLADQSGETLTNIVVAVKKVNDIIVEIATAGQEQLFGIKQVNKAVVQMDEITQQNAALVEETAATSESMYEQVERLKTDIAFFVIKN